MADNTRKLAPTDDNYDKLYKLLPMINGMKEQLKHAYNIGQKVRADKNIVNLKENGEGEILSNSTFP